MKNNSADVKCISLEPAVIYKLMLISFLATVIYTASISGAYAQTDTPMGTVLCNVVSMVYGNMGRGIITLAICVVGIGATLGKMSWGMAMTVGVGCSIVANAGNIAGALGSGIAGC